MSPGAVRAAARTRDAYLERDRHRVLFERPLGRSPTTSAVPERWHSSRDGRYWVAVPDAGGVTQARRLDQLPGRIAEVLSLMTGEAVSAADVELDVHYDDEELGRRAAELRDRRAALEVSEKQLTELTAETARALRQRGMSLRDIGVLTAVSYQRAHQLVS
jgi:hypothetical protein